MEGKSACLYKLLVVGVIVLFIGMGINSAFAVDVSISKTSDNEMECNKKHNSIGLGFIMCLTAGEFYFTPNQVILIPVGFVLVSCTDLDTGEVRYGFTFVSFCFFKFLKRGHSYKISAVPSNFNSDDVYINNLKFFEVVQLVHKVPPP